MVSIPVYKVGLVALRTDGAQRLLLVRPHAKHAGEQAPLVLPRGSRQYRAGGEWLDVRDDEHARIHAADLEPLLRTLQREAREEAGVPPELLCGGDLRELGERLYASPSQPRPVHWYVLALDADGIAQLDANPEDAAELRWVTLDEMRQLAEAGQARAGYVPVAEEALAKWKGLPKVSPP